MRSDLLLIILKQLSVALFMNFIPLKFVFAAYFAYSEYIHVYFIILIGIIRLN